MQRIAKRGLALFLALLLSFSFLLTSGAAVSAANGEGETTGRGDVRFVFGSLTSQKNIVYTADDEPFTLALSTEDRNFIASDLSLLTTASNALYFALVNGSGATEIHVSYTYEENGLQKTETLTSAIKPHTTEEQTFLLEAPHISGDVTGLALSFVSEGAIDGAVTLLSLFNLSSYFYHGENEVELTRCHYNADTASIEIKGTLDYDTAVLYAEKTLALFSLESNEDLHLFNKAPLARAGVSFEFSFTVDAKSADALFCRYVVAVVNENGEIVPLCDPVYPAVSTSNVTPHEGFKGVHTESLSTVIDSAPDFEVVDVYLDRLYCEQGNGILYTGEKSYYYFDTAYINELDTRVRNLVGLGAEVYLRFLISPNANDLSYADFAGADGSVINKLPIARNEQATQDLYAVINFITARYADATVGKVNGVVIGRSADRAATFNYTAAEGMEAYVKLYANTLNLIATTTAKNMPDARVILPVSDRIFTGVATKGMVEGDYYAEQFLPALLIAYTTQTVAPCQLFLMVESESLTDRVEVNAALYGVDRLDSFMSKVRTLAFSYPTLHTSIFYSFLPSTTADNDTLQAAYLSLYLTLLSRSDVCGFLLDHSLAEREGNGVTTESLSYLSRYIDTNRFSEVAQNALSTLGGTVQELWQGLDLSRVMKRNVQYTSLSHDGFSVTPVGQYTAWNFAFADGTLGWYGGTHCRDLAVHTDGSGDRSLTAVMVDSSEYSDLAYHFGSATDLTFAPYFSLDFAILGESDARYELQLRLCGESDTILASTVVTAGERQTVYLDLSAAKEALGSLRALRLATRSLDGGEETFTLCLYGVSLGSDELDSTALAERIDAILRGDNVSSNDAEEQDRDLRRPLVITAIVVFVSAALIASLILRRKRKKLLKKKQERQ